MGASPKNLCIDANVYLSFFELKNEQIEALRIVGRLVDSGKVTLVVPQRVVDEFEIKRDEVLARTKKRVAGEAPKLEVATCIAEYPETGDVLRAKERYEKAHARLMERLSKEISDGSLQAEQLVRELFAQGTRLPHSSRLDTRAVSRRALGKPPSGAGDCLIWESLLELDPCGGDVHFVTDDGDFCSPLDRAMLHPFLAIEWASKSVPLTLHKRLSSFLASEYPSQTSAADIERTFLIDDFLGSGSFLETHRTIAKLEKVGDFSDAEANKILEGSLKNGQVSQIIDDPDVDSFVRRVFSTHRSALDASVVAAYDNLWNPRPRSIAIEEGDEDFPF